MAKPRIDFGQLTEEETVEVLKEAMEQLDALQVSAAILDVFNNVNDRAEIAAQISDDT